MNHRRFLQLISILGLALATVPATRSNAKDYSPSFSTFLGGVNGDALRDVAFGPQGSVYVTGGTGSSDFPTTPGAYDRSANGSFDVFVAKFDASGALLWSTYLGGPNYDRAYGLEVDAQGNAYVAGRAGSGFPTTSGVVQPQFGGDVNPNGAYGQQDGFVTKLSSDGSRIVWSTYFGSDDKEVIRDLDIDGAGNVYVAVTEIGRTHPHITAGVFQPTHGGGKDHVVAKLSSDGRQVRYASYLGGSGDDGWPPSIRVDGSGNAYFLGHTFSDDFPVTPNAIQSSRAGNVDLFLAKISPNGSSLLFATYLGGKQADISETHGLALDGSGNAFVGAGTESRDLVTTPGAFQTSYQGSGGSSTGGGTNYPGDGFVMKISSNGSTLLGATYLGGSEGEGIEGVDVDSQGNVYVSGATYSHNFPVTGDATQGNLGGSSDFFVAKLRPDLKGVTWATFVGGSNTDQGRSLSTSSAGNVVVGGLTLSTNWPTKAAWQDTFGGGADGGLGAFSISRSTSDSDFVDDFESGDLSLWPVAKGPNIAVVSPGLKGSSFALQVSVDGSTVKSFVASRHDRALDSISVSLLVSPNRAPLGQSRVEVLRLVDQKNRTAARLTLEKKGKAYQVRLLAADDASGLIEVGSTKLAGRGTSRLRILWQRSSSPSGTDGVATLSKRKALAGRRSDLRNGTSKIRSVRIGLPDGSSGVSGVGSLLIDKIVIRR